MADVNQTQAIESLAAEIGENIYIDVAKWHLYLAEAHLHTVVAQKVYPLLESDSIEPTKVVEILRSIPVELGGGKISLSLADLLPNQCQTNLLNLLEDYQRDR